jgi:hypothetical protein
MPRKRVFLDEHLDPRLGLCFGQKAHVFSATELGVSGMKDPEVIEKAVQKKCLIVTANKDFLQHYRNHRLRKGKVRYFYGLIFLKPSKSLTREAQLKKALAEIAWDETRHHDDLIIVYADGHTSHERLCHPECAEAFAKQEEY